MLAFDLNQMVERINIIMMLLLTSVALSQVSVTAHKRVPYSTHVEHYMSVGCALARNHTLTSTCGFPRFDGPFVAPTNTIVLSQFVLLTAAFDGSFGLTTMCWPGTCLRSLFLLTLATTEVAIVANVDAADELRFQSLEWWFYGGIGLLWLLRHLLLFCCGDTALFRSASSLYLREFCNRKCRICPMIPAFLVYTGTKES